MEWLTIAASLVGLVAVGVGGSWVISWWRVREGLRYQVDVDGERLSLPEAWWRLHRAGAGLDLLRIDSARPRQVHEHLKPYLREPMTLAPVHSRADELNKELRKVVVAQQALPRTAQAFDVAAISLGAAVANVDYIAGTAVVAASAVATAVVESKAGPLGDLFPGSVGGLAEAAGEGVQALAEPVVNALGDGFMVPVGTVWTGGRRMLRGMEAGVSRERIAENAALDLGVQGGGTMTGAALGTFLIPVPVVGTVVGSVVGGFLGSTFAGVARGRHLGRARERWMSSLDAFGSEVDVADFEHLGSVMDRSLAVKEEALAGLRRTSSARRRKVWPNYGDRFIVELLACAERDVDHSTLVRKQVRALVRVMGRADPASRALYWLRYGRPKETARLSALTQAASHYHEEYLTTQALA